MLPNDAGSRNDRHVRGGREVRLERYFGVVLPTQLTINLQATDHALKSRPP